MITRNGITDFDWDKGNLEKSYSKHKISSLEAEEIFLDSALIVLHDSKHSLNEERYVALGQTIQSRILFTVFTLRKNKIRVISARPANKNERSKYRLSRVNA